MLIDDEFLSGEEQILKRFVGPNDQKPKSKRPSLMA